MSRFGIEFRKNINSKLVDKHVYMHQKLTNMYFLFQGSWGFNKETQIQEWNAIYSQLSEFRKEVFKESVFIKANASNVLLSTINMMNAMDTKRAELSGFRTEDSEYGSQKFSQTASKYLDDSEKWVRENVILNDDLRSLELSKDMEAKFIEIKTEKEMGHLGLVDKKD